MRPGRPAFVIGALNGSVELAREYNTWLHEVSHVARMNVSCHAHEGVILHLGMRHVSCMSETWNWRENTHNTRLHQVSRVTCMNESRHTNTRVMARWGMCCVTRMDESCHSYERVKSHIWMDRVTHVNESCHTCEGHGIRLVYTH